MEPTAIERLPITWLETRVRALKISWGVFVALLCVFLFAIEISYSLRSDVNKFLGVAVYDIIIQGYALVAWAITRAALTRALKAIRPLIETYTEPTPGLQREWQFSFGVGIPLTLLLVFTNPIVNESLNQPTTWLYVFSQLIESCLLGWVVFALLSSANQITNFISQATVVNIFDATPYRPVANWCLTVAATIMGAITIAVLFLGKEMMSGVNLAVYIITGLLGIFIFFGGMWSTHQHMLKNKERELNSINTELLSLHHEIMIKVNSREFEASRLLMDATAGLTTHKHVVEKADTWPYTVGSIGGLATSVFVPVFINLLTKIF